jgi:hypothetical protein
MAQQGVCTASEMKFYFNSLLDSGEKNYVRPNKNCMQPLLLDRRL